MSRRRSLVVAGIGVVMGAILAMAFGGSGARGVGGGEAPPDWWSPPKDVRAMLGQVEASSLERFDNRQGRQPQPGGLPGHRLAVRGSPLRGRRGD